MEIVLGCESEDEASGWIMAIRRAVVRETFAVRALPPLPPSSTTLHRQSSYSEQQQPQQHPYYHQQNSPCTANLTQTTPGLMVSSPYNDLTLKTLPSPTPVSPLSISSFWMNAPTATASTSPVKLANDVYGFNEMMWSTHSNSRNL
jgi:hypothetical protein